MAKRKNEQEACLWERQKGESEQAWQAFTIYLQQEKRNLKAVADELHKSYTLIRRWKDTWFWEDRVVAYDNELLRESLEKAKKARRTMYSNHAGAGQRLVKYAVEALELKQKAQKPENMSFKDIREMIKIGAELERLSRDALIENDEKNTETAQTEDVVVIVPDDGLNNGNGEDD